MTSPFTPERIRALRGDQSRAAFARTLGVTPQTVYRWELPEGAAEARRPRGLQLARLQELAGNPPPSAATLVALPTAATQARPSLPDDDASRVLPALERVMRGDLRRGHGELVHAVASSPGLSAGARALACYGIALCELMDRADARAALMTIAPLLADAEAGRLGHDVSAKLFSVAALCHAFPDALLFDLGRVHAYQARIESMRGLTDDDARCTAYIAAMCAATWIGDVELLERVFARLEETRWNALSPVLELHIEEFRSLRAMYGGRGSPSLHSSELGVQRAEQQGYPLLLSRSLGRLALVQLDVLSDPEEVLAVAQRALAIARSARIACGVHHLLALRAKIEALLRLGRTQEALAASAEVDAWSTETGLPALPAVSAQTRLYSLTGRVESMQTLVAQLRSCELPSLRKICQAYATYVEACAAFAQGDDPRLALALYEQAETQAAHWPFLLREVLLYRVYAYAAAGDEAAGRIALRRAQRFIDGFPSPWFTAHMRRLEGGLLAARGQWLEGKQQLQTAAATFDLAKDACDAALTRFLQYLIADGIEEGGAAQQLAEARSELARLELPEPRSMRSGVARFHAQNVRTPAQAPGRSARSIERLVVPFQRVAMRGAAPNLILSELMSVARGLFADRPVFLEELDSSGSSRPLCDQPASGEVDWVEFSDGAGRLLRLGVAGELDREDRSTLSLLAMNAALSLEVAVLRSVGERPPVSASLPPMVELPGFVAASVEMRKLRAELVRLAGSQSTVIITGESGAGKEIVARAIHDLSERSSRPYVAFNCATVPRELFEGQLFGYRRGAFTGATADHPGVIRAANGGTLFLDEIGELPLDIQPKLLRFLENSEVFPLGERAPVRVDVRVLAATHRDLAALVREGRFREDLYYRLQVVPVFVPPLRERRADVPVLARHFLRELTRRGDPPVLAPDALAALLEQRFPGNVRELKNIIERALAYFPDQPVLRAEHLRLSARPAGGRSPTELVAGVP
ncbi:MAG TPA: sigma 54-interacting transcriptional regulator [Polyangiales bacterium]|nr:sigma 54-interacting transcriptional regulator [Polyangiales bacterium]